MGLKLQPTTLSLQGQWGYSGVWRGFKFTARRLPISVLSLATLHIELARSFKSKEFESKAILCAEPLVLKVK
jgi:hypothetical protein